MTRRIQGFSAVVAALAALALGGAVLAQAQPTPSGSHERTSGQHLDKIQSGDRTGDTSSETAPSDGPGGHADPTGAIAHHEFQGVE